ncbi:MAG: HAMP domain-containing histidine kinase [Leptospiraceae bacterium]|nr:HAMP domain-containing histidine kinase [Leptospiraceae bacterium]
MRASEELRAVDSYSGLARCLLRQFGQRAGIRAVAVRDGIGLWHPFPGRRALAEAKGFEPLDALPRIAVLPHSLRKLRRPLRFGNLKDILALKLETLDLRQRLKRSELLRSAEMRYDKELRFNERRRLRRDLGETMEAFGRHSHDLKTPFSMLTITLDKLVLQEEKLPAKLRLKLEGIKLMIFSVLRTVGNTLDAARILGHKKQTLRIPHNLSDFVRSIAELYSIVFDSYGIKLSAEIEPGIIAEVDPLQIEKVINNLLSNALKHNLPGGRAQISLKSDGRRATLVITDGGLGMTQMAAQSPRVNSAWALSSHGFGLKIVRELVRLNRGKFALHSRTGLGTSAVVDLPVALSRPKKGEVVRAHPIYHTMQEVELLAHERTALSRRKR